MNKSMFPGKYGLALSAAGAALLLLAVLLLVATAQSAAGRAGMNNEGLPANPLPQSVDSQSADGVPAGWSQVRPVSVRMGSTSELFTVGQQGVV